MDKQVDTTPFTPPAEQIEAVAEEENDIVLFVEKLQCLPINMTSRANQDYIEMGEAIYRVAKQHFKASGAMFRNSAEYAEADDFWTSQDIGWEELNDDVKNELRDYHFLLCNVSHVYCAITGNVLSYPNYPHRVVIAEYERNLSQQIEEAIKDEASGAKHLRVVAGFLQNIIDDEFTENLFEAKETAKAALSYIPEHLKAQS